MSSINKIEQTLEIKNTENDLRMSDSLFKLLYKPPVNIRQRMGSLLVE